MRPGQVEVAESSHAVEAAALSRFWEYQRRPPDDPADTAREAYLAGFRAGGKWAIRISSRLADPDVQAAIRVLAELSEVDQ